MLVYCHSEMSHWFYKGKREAVAKFLSCNIVQNYITQNVNSVIADTTPLYYATTLEAIYQLKLPTNSFFDLLWNFC